MIFWIFQTGEPLHSDGDDVRAMRAINLADTLLSAGHEVVIWSSDFFHQKKEFRYGKYSEIDISNRLKIVLVPSCGYKRNIGFSRIVDHVQLGYRLKKYLQNCSDLPDVAFIGYPPIEFAYTASKFLVENNIPYILDAKDRWPDYFVEKLPKLLRFVGELIFFPWYRQAGYIFKNASAYSTISMGYLDWMIGLGGSKVGFERIIPLTTRYDLDGTHLGEAAFNDCLNKFVEKYDFIFMYAGSLTKTLNFQPIVDAASYFADNDRRVGFVVCGDGGERKVFEAQFAGLGNVLFTGWLDKSVLNRLSYLCTASIIPYRNTISFTSGIPNKLYDALALGLPVLNSLEGEVNALIKENNIGFCYDQKDSASFVAACSSYISDPGRWKSHSDNCRRLYMEKFEFNAVYNSLLELITKLRN